MTSIQQLDPVLEVQEQMDEELLEVCEYHDCKQKRTHLIICPRCRSAENMCEEHASMARNAPRDNCLIFNRTCFHTVPMCVCGQIRVDS